MPNAPDSQLNARRVRYLEVGKAIVQEVSKRDSLFYDICPTQNRLPDDARKSALKGISVVGKRLGQLCDQLRAIETEPGPRLGIPTLFEVDPGNPLRVVVAMLLVVACSSEARRLIHDVGQIIDVVGGRDPATALALRMAFRADGLLRPHIRFDLDVTLGECCNVALTEATFNTLLALPPDPEFMAMDNLRAKMGRIRA